MSAIIFLIIILGIAIGAITFFIVRTVINPRKIASLETLLKQGKTSTVTRTAKQILAKESSNCAAHYILGKAYLADNKPELALMELKAVNRLADFNHHCPEQEYRLTIAQLYANFNQPEEALKEYLLLLKMEPDNGDYYYKAGKLFEDRNKTEKAVQFYRKTLELDKRHSDAHFSLGNILYRQKKYTEAREELEIALRFQPENYKAYYILGKILKESHDYVTALHTFEKAQRDPEYKVKSLIERGGCYIQTGSLDRAVTELERAVSLSTSDSASEVLYARYFLGFCYEKMRNIDRAVEQWEKIYTKKPTFKDVAEKLSQYQDIRQDDMMKEYLTCGKEDFIMLAMEVVKKMGLSVRDSGIIPNGCQIIAVDGDSKWVGTRKIPKLIWFLRVPELLSESTPRALHEEMKKQSLGRGIIFSSSNFSRKAITFAESRPIDMIGKDKLQTMLKGINLPAPPSKSKR
ncbi:MAG: tetratricopeptide repeat protein [Spirochaetales bacterium]|nr:tetratricopeptide repeat protein [Spirochaetales bacterium]